MPGSIGWQGLVVILLVLLVVFGPKRLPELGRSLGRGMREFKDAVTGESEPEPPSETQSELAAKTTAPTETASSEKTDRVSSST
jgi:sec-independent protein translocase protein TatA